MSTRARSGGEALRRVDVVLHDQHAEPRAAARRPVLREGRVEGQCRREERESHDELAATPAPGTARLDRPAVQLDEPLDECEPDPESALLAVERHVLLREQAEDAVERLGDEPHARVADPDLGPVTRGAHVHLDGPPARCELRRVRQNVPDDLREAGPVGLDPERLRRQVHVKLVRPLLHQRTCGFDRVPDDLPEIEAHGRERDLAARHPGHVTYGAASTPGEGMQRSGSACFRPTPSGRSPASSRSSSGPTSRRAPVLQARAVPPMVAG